MTHYSLPRGNNRQPQTCSAQRTVKKSKENTRVTSSLLCQSGRQKKKRNSFSINPTCVHIKCYLGTLLSFLFPDSSVFSNQNREIKPHLLIWGRLGIETQLTWVWSWLLVLRGANLLPSAHSVSLGSQARTRTQHGVPTTSCTSLPTGTLNRTSIFTSKQLGWVTTGRFLSGATQSHEKSQNVHQEAQKRLESHVYRVKGADLYPKCTSFPWPWGLRHF